MNEFEELENKLKNLLEQGSPPPVELRKAILELDEWINSQDFSSASQTQRELAQSYLMNLRSRLRQSEGNEAPSPTDAQQDPQIQPDEFDDLINIEPEPDFSGDNLTPIKSTESGSKMSPAHQPQAEEWMEDAERLFYRGRYTDAIRLFDRILQIEPKWERARQHRNEAENYLRTGYIPPVALPSEAASAFGKAQSAARVGRYKDALALIGKAQAVLRDSGIQRWQEGLEFEQKLQESIDAENVFQEGVQLFDQGNLDEAIESVETAARATG